MSEAALALPGRLRAEVRRPAPAPAPAPAPTPLDDADLRRGLLLLPSNRTRRMNCDSSVSPMSRMTSSSSSERDTTFGSSVSAAFFLDGSPRRGMPLLTTGDNAGVVCRHAGFTPLSGFLRRHKHTGNTQRKPAALALTARFAPNRKDTHSFRDLSVLLRSAA